MIKISPFTSSRSNADTNRGVVSARVNDYTQTALNRIKRGRSINAIELKSLYTAGYDPRWYSEESGYIWINKQRYRFSLSPDAV